MGREVARGGDEDRSNLGFALPRKALLHGGLQVLDHVEASILAKDRMAQNCNDASLPCSTGSSRSPTTVQDHWQQVGDGHKRGKSNAPAIAMGGAIEQGVARKLRGRYAGRCRAEHRLADYQTGIVGKAIIEALSPMGRLVARCGRGRHPNLTVDDPNRACRHVVCPEIEGRTAAQIKTGMMPMASEDTVLNASAVKGKPHMRAPVVEGDHIVIISHDKHGATGRPDHHVAAVA
jgi:hypothetical protein